jgi:tRNA1(Val) A37 N6-methylase TrmN6
VRTTQLETAATAERTIDAFHRGDFWVTQPAGKGHRSGMDAMMLAATVPGSFSGRLADLGAGAGAAGMAVASRCPKSRVLLVERSAEMAAFARESAALPQNVAIAGRVDVLEADVTLAGKARVAAGLEDSAFDFAIMNPPFNLGHDRPTPDALKKEAHVMEEGLLEAWIRTAGAIVKPRGGMAIIARPQSLTAILDALRGRFGDAQIVPVHPRASEPAIRIILRAVRGSRKALSLHPPLVLHGDTGHGHAPRADRVCNGRESLFGD